MSRSIRGSRPRRCRDWLGLRSFTRTQLGLGSFIALWLIYLLVSASERPSVEESKHSRSLLAASSIKGRLDAVDFGSESKENLRAIIRSAVSPGFRDQLLQNKGGSKADAYDPTYKFIESVAAEIAQTEQQVLCPWDPTLEVDLPRLSRKKYLLAANFRNNEELLPHAIVQIWHLLALMPEDSAFVSIYESGSTDSTAIVGAWLEILRQMLSSMKVPHRIIIGGNLTRSPEQDRIDFLAEVRNAALEPLWLDVQEPAPTNSSAWFSNRKTTKLWPADKVVFFNDVYFCARDVVRLLLHGADMACGMDFDRRKLDQVPVPVQQSNLKLYLKQKMKLPEWVSGVLGLIPAVLLSQAASNSANEFFRRDLPMGFYDLWVGRDMNGAMFLKDEPYATDPYTLQRLPKGLPFPVKCCWNGLVALDARPFIQHGIRIRSHKKGECAASECSLLCNDFLRLGYQKMLVDPGVRQAYNVDDVRRLYNRDHVRGIQLTSWADVVRATPIDTSLTPFRPFEQCCSLKPGNDMVDFEHDCAWENVMKPNFTARAEVLEPRSVNLTSTTMSAPRRMQKLRGLIVRNVNEVN